MQRLRQQTIARPCATALAVVKSDAGLIAGGFDAEDKQGEGSPAREAPGLYMFNQYSSAGKAVGSILARP